MVFSWIMGMRPAALALLLAAGFCVVSVRGQGGGASTAPAAPPAKSDAQPASTGSSTFREIKEELFGPLEPYSPRATINRLMNTAPQAGPQFLPRVDDEKTRLLRRRQQEWIFSDLNDLNSPPSLEDLAGLPDYGLDGRDKNKIPPMERYFEELQLKRGAGSNSANNAMTLMLNQAAFSGSNSMNSFMFMAPGMNGLMGDQPGGSNSVAAGNHDVGGGFTASAPAGDTAALLDQKKRLENFKRLLSSDSPGFAPADPPPAGTFGRFNDLLNFGAAPARAGIPAVAPIAPASYPGNASPGIGSVNPAGPGYHSSMNVAPPTTFTVPGATRLTTLPPPPPPPKPVSLDPFKDNMPKRSF